MEIEDPHDKFKGDEDVPLRYRYKTKKFGELNRTNSHP